MNICFRLASIPIDNWSVSSAELIQILIKHPKLTQKALARRLRVSQPSVSERQNRSHYEEIMLLNELYREKINNLIAAK
jgi:transcriptional regulator with XRE-family HTH domain